VKPARDRWLNPALALALCAAAGAVMQAIRAPLPWMIGPLLVMALCNFGGARLRAPRPSRPVGQVIIGVALGLYFTPAVAREVLSYWPLLIAAALLAMLLAWTCAWLLAAVGGVDRVTAFFASVPGGATEMAVLGERYGGRVDRVALAQSLRILTVVIVVPFALAWSGARGEDSYLPGVAVAFDAGGLAALLALAAAAGGVLSLARLPNAFMFGPLIATIALTVSEQSLSSVPGWLSGLGQLLLGCALGSRFERAYLSSMARYVGAVFASILFAIALAAGSAFALAWLSGLPVATLVLATAPGGIAEMCIMAKVLQLGAPLVTAAHVTRVIVLLATTAPVFRLMRRFL
jgi:membrane AbrB-like protein